MTHWRAVIDTMRYGETGGPDVERLTAVTAGLLVLIGAIVTYAVLAGLE